VWRNTDNAVSANLPHTLAFGSDVPGALDWHKALQVPTRLSYRLTWLWTVAKVVARKPIPPVGEIWIASPAQPSSLADISERIQG